MDFIRAVEVDVIVQHTMDFDSDFLFSSGSFQNVRQLQGYLADRVGCHYHCGESPYLQQLISSCFKSATSVADSKREFEFLILPCKFAAYDQRMRAKSLVKSRSLVLNNLIASARRNFDEKRFIQSKVQSIR